MLKGEGNSGYLFRYLKTSGEKKRKAVRGQEDQTIYTEKKKNGGVLGGTTSKDYGEEKRMKKHDSTEKNGPDKPQSN